MATDTLIPRKRAAIALRRLRLDGWSLFTLAVAALVSVPVLVVLSYVFVPAGDTWRHLADTVLTRYITNSIWLIIGVGAETRAATARVNRDHPRKRTAIALRRLRLDGWSLFTLAVAALVSVPVLVVLSYVFVPAGDTWRHLADTVLTRYITNSIWLIIGVGAGTLVIGVGGAWLVTMCRFPGRPIFESALLLPMAVPAYVIAYTYTGLFEFAGPVQGFLREFFGWSRGDYWFPEIRSLGGAIAMMTLVLYPYVYLLSRAAFLEQSVCVLEASRTLGCNAWRCFSSVALPLARPAIATGVALALMETLNDFGTVQYFAVDTFTTGIFRTWLGMGEPAAAAQLAAMLMLFWPSRPWFRCRCWWSCPTSSSPPAIPGVTSMTRFSGATSPIPSG